MIILRTANDKIFGRLAPVFFEPRDVCFETAGGYDHRLCVKFLQRAIAQRASGEKLAVAHVQLRHLGLVSDLNSELCRSVVVRIDHRFAAAEHEEIRPGQVERAAQRLLPAYAAGRHPGSEIFGGANRQAGKLLVGFSAGDLAQVLPKFFLDIGAGDKFSRAPVQVAEIARMAAVAAAKILRRAFDNQHTRTRAACADSRAQRRVAAADDEYVDCGFFLRHEKLATLCRKSRKIY